MRRMMFGAGVMTIALAVAVTLSAQGGPPGGGGRGQGGGGGRGGGRGGGPPMAMTTTAFEDGGVIPAKFVGGMGVSPSSTSMQRKPSAPDAMSMSPESVWRTRPAS